MISSFKLKQVIEFIKELFPDENPIPLHRPFFGGNEKKYLSECIDTSYVSSVGKFVDQFERMTAEFTGSGYAVAVVNGTNALQVALRLAGVSEKTEVLTQPLTFVATCNAVKYLSAEPVFIDVDLDTMALSAERLDDFLKKTAIKKSEGTYNRETGRKIAACLPMHTFGFPARVDEIIEICEKWNIPVVEDAAESIGSYNGNVHTGRKGLLGVLSFNGNKTITTGGGGMIITDDDVLGKKAKYLTTTAKVPHNWDFFHDDLGYNFRLPNINAALGCAQMEQLSSILENKRGTASAYKNFFQGIEGIDFLSEREGTTSNYWLCTVVLDNRGERDMFLKETNDAGIMTRPIWTLMYRLPVYSECFRCETNNAEWLEERVVNLPSSVRL